MNEEKIPKAPMSMSISEELLDEMGKNLTSLNSIYHQLETVKRKLIGAPPESARREKDVEPMGGISISEKFRGITFSQGEVIAGIENELSEIIRFTGQ